MGENACEMGLQEVMAAAQKNFEILNELRLRFEETLEKRLKKLFNEVGKGERSQDDNRFLPGAFRISEYDLVNLGRCMVLTFICAHVEGTFNQAISAVFGDCQEELKKIRNGLKDRKKFLAHMAFFKERCGANLSQEIKEEIALFGAFVTLRNRIAHGNRAHEEPDLRREGLQKAIALINERENEHDQVFLSPDGSLTIPGGSLASAFCAAENIVEAVLEALAKMKQEGESANLGGPAE